MICSVLAVDDNPEILDSVSGYLRTLDYGVETAASAPEALTIMREGRVPRVLVSDIVMPGTIDGVELARIVAKSYPETGILLMTGWSLDQDHSFHCLSKPFHLKEIDDWIKAFLAI